MGILHSNRRVLDDINDIEVVLEILSFSGGENSISEDQATKENEARVLENWRSLSLGGMIREPGFSLIADGTGTYTDKLDLLIEHKDSGGTEIFAISEGDLIKKSSDDFVLEDNGAFTTGVLSHAVSAGDYCWITNATDNLKRKAVGVAIATPSSQPTTACARVYNHKNRLLAEGSASVPNRVYGSRTGKGNWTAVDAWSLANDAWSIDLPENTAGCAPGFPSGNEVVVFTERNTYALSNFPNTSFRPLSTPGRGCSAPYSVATGDDGVYFLSKFPTLGVFRYNGVEFQELTEFNRDVFVEDINFSNRIFGVYKDKRYYLFYNESNSGVSYPNRCRIYDARFGRWMNRPVASALSDFFGYPAVLKESGNLLYFGSSTACKAYDYDNGTDSDAGQSTASTYTTKVFSSRDFAIASGGQFPMDDVKLKLEKITVTYFGTVGSVGVLWTADRGLHSGSKTLDLTANGDQLNTTFIVNTSYITSTPADKTVSKSFPNDAVGRRFDFSITNSGTSTRPKIKKVKIHAVTLDES